MLPYDSRTAVAQDPPSSGRLPVVEDLPTAAQRAELRRGISPEELRALLANPKTQKSIRAVVASRLVGGAESPLMDDLVQEANLLMLASRLGPRSTASAPGWIATIAWRAVADYFRRASNDRKWMAPDDEVEIDDLPAKDEPSDEEVLLSDWLARAVAGDAKDAETLEMLLYKARLGATYDEVAAQHGLTSNALRCRVNAFKTRYEERWRKHRAMLMLLLVVAIAAVTVSAWLWLLSKRSAWQTVPAPTVPTMPTTHPSATASARDTPFEPAAPPTATAAPPAPLRTEPPRPTPTQAPKRPDTPPQRYNQSGKPI